MSAINVQLVRRCWLATYMLLMSCYSPTFPVGYSCSPSGGCPPDQVCDTTSHTCRSTPGNGAGNDAGMTRPPGCVAEGSSCANGETCCAGTCNSLRVCEVCGFPSQPCCGVSTCYNGGCCVYGMCHANMSTCVTTQCIDFGCGGGTCGRAGQQCCTPDICTSPETRCISGTCVPCGRDREKCCLDPKTMASNYCSPPNMPEVVNTTCFCFAM